MIKGEELFNFLFFLIFYCFLQNYKNMYFNMKNYFKFKNNYFLKKIKIAFII